MKKETKAKYDLLCDLIREKGRLAVAFSSGVDSTMLLKTAADVLSGNVIAVTARSVSFPERESNESVRFCSQIGVPQIIVETDQFSIEGFADNPADRCYICKKALFGAIIEAARNNGFDTVAEGSNMDDLSDYRPGLRAIAELGVMSPLREAGLFKEEIREISRELGLPTWSKPSFACLATRFVYGEKITEEKLRRVDRSEQLLMDMGFHQLRVRIHGSDGKLARIEVMPDELPRLLADREEICRKLREFGFDYVTMDMDGYRTGSMNAPVLRG